MADLLVFQEAVILSQCLTLKRKAILAVSASLLLALALGGVLAQYLISLNTYSEMEQRMKTASDSLHMAITLLLKQSVQGYLRGVSDTHLELIQLLDETMGEVGKDKSRELMLRQRIGDSGYMVALNCSDPEQPKIDVHPNPDLVGKGLDYFPFLKDECAKKRGLFEFVINAPGVTNKPKSIWLNTYDPWRWTFGPAPFNDRHSELIQLDEVRPYIEQINHLQQGSIFIMNSQGKMLFHPDVEGENVANYIDVKTGQPFVQQALERIQKQIAINPQEVNGGGSRFHLEDPKTHQVVEYITRYRYMPETGWIIGVKMKTTDIGLPTRQLAMALLLSFIISALLMTWLLNLLSRTFFSDVAALNTAVKRVGGGYFDIEILSTRDDELGELSATFVQMAKNLAELDRKQTLYRQELEQKVQERTQELKEQNAKLERLSVTDCLTCVGNRRHFDQVLFDEIVRANRTQTELCLMLLDVDYFKAYNDCYGHPAGDEVLRRIAQVMTQCAQRSIDLVARYGGEEFTLVALDTNLSGAKKIGLQIQSQLDELNIEHLDSPLKRVTVSIGICVMTPDAGFSAESLVEAADSALYKAKEKGRNRIEAVRV